MNDFDVLVLGGGPAGLSAAIYLARGKRRVCLLDRGTVGGQVLLTHAVANYPGIPERSGYEIAAAMRAQAVEFGCEIVSNVTIESVDLRPDTKSIHTAKGVYTARAVVLAMGGAPRTLELESEARLQGRGISYCATCDGDFFQDQDILVVGGGNSALEEAVALTKYASSVTVVHQFDHFQAYAHAVAEAQNNHRISFRMESVVEEFVGDDTLTGAVIRHVPTGETKRIDATGAFVLIGYVPRTESVAECVVINERGEIVADEAMATSVPGVFVAGDARAKRYRQITTAVGDGTIAALSAMEYLEAKLRSPA